MKHKTALIAATAALLALTACGTEDSRSRASEEEVAEQQLEGFLKAQPIPVFNWSQLRQNLIELQTAQANTTATTSFFFNQGVAEPVMSCPSIGFPIPATYQLTNPDNIVLPGGPERGSIAIPQLESTGVYSGDTTGTYVMCVNADGEAFAFYWEGFVSTVTGPAEFTDGRITLTGESTFDFSEGK